MLTDIAINDSSVSKRGCVFVCVLACRWLLQCTCSCVSLTYHITGFHLSEHCMCLQIKLGETETQFNYRLKSNIPAFMCFYKYSKSFLCSYIYS